MPSEIRCKQCNGLMTDWAKAIIVGSDYYCCNNCHDIRYQASAPASTPPPVVNPPKVLGRPRGRKPKPPVDQHLRNQRRFELLKVLAPQFIDDRERIQSLACLKAVNRLLNHLERIEAAESQSP